MENLTFPPSPLVLYRRSLGYGLNASAKLLQVSHRTIADIERGLLPGRGVWDGLIGIGADPRAIAHLSFLQAEWSLARHGKPDALTQGELRHLYQRILPPLLWDAAQLGARLRLECRGDGGAA